MSFYAYVKQPDDDEIIWHYLDFAKYMILLDQRALFFELASQINVQLEGYGAIGQVIPGTERDTSREIMNQFATLSQSCLVVSCWYMHSSESAALWKQHPHTPIAIQSTIARLKKGLNYSMLKYAKIGAVNYHPPTLRPDETGVSVEVDYYFKRQSFQHEREMRVLAQARDLTAVTSDEGLAVPATFETLVMGVRIAPTAPRWLVKLVQSVTRDTYHLDTDIIQTDLHEMAIT